MNLSTRLRQLAEALPPAGSVVLTRADLMALLEEDGASTTDDGHVDLTVEQVAEKLGRAPSTIRNWVREGRIPGAYKLRGRENRIPRAALRSFLEREANSTNRASTPQTKAVDLSAWRNHIRPTS